jgi:taurine dioxygenase
VNEGFTAAIVGLAEAESAALLVELYAVSARPDFIYRHHWRPGDLVLWDNRCVVHRATWYDPAAIRHLHRTTIACDAVPMAA